MSHRSTIMAHKPEFEYALERAIANDDHRDKRAQGNGTALQPGCSVLFRYDENCDQCARKTMHPHSLGASMYCSRCCPACARSAMAGRRASITNPAGRQFVAADPARPASKQFRTSVAAYVAWPDYRSRPRPLGDMTTALPIAYRPAPPPPEAYEDDGPP